MSTCSAVSPASIVVAAALPGKGGGYLGGGSSIRAFWGLVESTHLAGLAPDSQEVASQTSRYDRRVRSDATTNGMTGGGGGSPTNRDEKRQGTDRVGGGTYWCLPP